MVMLFPIFSHSYVLKSDITKSPASFTLPAGVVMVFLFFFWRGGTGGRWVFASISEL